METKSPNPSILCPIPRILWESLEIALTAKVHALAKDIAKALDVDVKPLMTALTKEKVSAYLVEQADIDADVSDLRCPCGAAIAWMPAAAITKKRCPEHLGMERIEIYPLHYLEEDGAVVDSAGNPRQARWIHTTRTLRLFETV
jgi:hypothetical protein